MKNIDLNPFLEFLSILKVLHWNAKTHTEHVVLGDAYDQFSDKIDEFVENYLGSSQDGIGIVGLMAAQYTNDSTIKQFQVAFNAFIDRVDEYAHLNVGLQSLRDDLLNIANRTNYLLKMK